MGATPPLLTVSGLTKSFATRATWGELLRAPFRRRPRVAAVQGVTFDVGPAEFFGLLGANGAGKTTLFKMLATHLLPDQGSAIVAGHDVVEDPRAVRRLLTPVVADERSLNWRLTARQNLELFAALYGLRGQAARDRIEELLRAVELQDAGTKLTGAFSSGMKQRLLIARALLSSPRVLLLDEPTRSLDPLSARRFRRFLRDEITGRQRCTVLLATHSAEEAFDLCDRVGVLNRGKLIAVGRTADLIGEVSDNRYRVTVDEEQVAQALRVAGSYATDAQRLAESGVPGWAAVEIRVAGGGDGAAELLAGLVGAGIRVSGCERVDLSLADLLEGLVLRRGGGPNA